MSDTDQKIKRRLAVYFIVDCSKSMGDDSAMDEVKKGLRDLRNRIVEPPDGRAPDRQTITTLWVAAYRFSNDPYEISPLVPIRDFAPNLDFQPAGQTMVSKALYLVHDKVQQNFRPPMSGMHGYKADYRPIVFLLTDGEPDPPGDPWAEAKRRLLDMRNPKLLRYIVVGFGDGIARENLYALGEAGNVFHFGRDRESFEDFFDWVSSSLVLASNSLPHGDEEFEVADTPNRVQYGDWSDPPKPGGRQ
ncbi:MAG TPA: VWA domain-containing protein [Chthonomonadaceae bacterium]|nr:VWA domain-containing protein [Chthonomonadaceae bacterium]